MIDAIKRHPTRTKVITIFFISLILFIIFFIILKKVFGIDCISIYYSEEEQQIIFFNFISLNNFLTLLTLIGMIVGAIWALMQYDKNTKVRQQEKAAEIAKDFADNLMERLALISNVLMPNQEIKKMLNKIAKSKKLNQFTTREICNILNDKQCFKKYDKIILSKNSQDRYDEILKKRYNENERQKFESYFPLLVENTLNHLEAICINISSKAAGSQFIYDSLHQSFLKTIELLSVKISSHNNNNIDKYFVNIIQVYNMWNFQKEQDIKRFLKTQRKIDSLITAANKEVDNLLIKKNKTV